LEGLYYDTFFARRKYEVLKIESLERRFFRSCSLIKHLSVIYRDLGWDLVKIFFSNEYDVLNIAIWLE